MVLESQLMIFKAKSTPIYDSDKAELNIVDDWYCIVAPLCQ
mgnify:CR=1 FL=1